MLENINTMEYWEKRFSSHDWEKKGGRWQTENYAKKHIKYMQISSNFEGGILDFGCGLGDAIPIYRKQFPYAKLFGIDISHSAIIKCKERFGEIAEFTQGDYKNVPNTDIIIASDVLEHLNNDRDIVKHLLSKCKHLFVIVPYKETPLFIEHVNVYDEAYFKGVGSFDFIIFYCAGWSQYGGRARYYNIYFKNILRYFLRKPLVVRKRKIMFRFF
jgi:SAM-dependent methyltransferase